MFFTFLFPFAISLCVPCCVVTEKVHQKRSTDPCANAVDPTDAAHTIRKNIIDAINRREKEKDLQYKQTAFLYVHGTSNQVVYNIEQVQDVLQGSEPLPNVQYWWPKKSKNTNFMFGVTGPNSPGQGPNNNEEHAEHMLVSQFGPMENGFRERNHQCPCFVLLSSKRDPCRDGETLAGCSYDYVRAKDSIAGHCKRTRFYLHVAGPVEARFAEIWKGTQTLMADNDIDVISP